MVTSSKLVQSKNVLDGKYLVPELTIIVALIVAVTSWEQPANIPLELEANSTVEGNVTVVKPVCLKALYAIEVTLLGIVIDVMEVQ